MELGAIKDRVEVLVERDIPEPLFLVAAREVIDDIEGRDYRITHFGEAEVVLDGSSSYYVPSGVDRENTQDVWYIPGSGKRGKLKEHYGTYPEGVSAPSYYSYFDKNQLRLDSLIDSGKILILYRAYHKKLQMEDKVLYPCMVLGIAAWLGTNAWEDSRKKQWQESFEVSLRRKLDRVLLRSSDVNDRE